MHNVFLSDYLRLWVRLLLNGWLLFFLSVALFVLPAGVTIFFLGGRLRQFLSVHFEWLLGRLSLFLDRRPTLEGGVGRDDLLLLSFLFFLAPFLNHRDDLCDLLGFEVVLTWCVVGASR